MSERLTVKEIKALLDAKGVEYNSKAKRADLLQLLDYEAPVEEKPKEYVVVVDFKDLEDRNYVYHKGDPYPHPKAKKPTPERIKSLSTTKNKKNKVLIRERS